MLSILVIGMCSSLHTRGAVAQLGEHLLCKQGVRGSIPRSSTKFLYFDIFFHIRIDFEHALSSIASP